MFLTYWVKRNGSTISSGCWVHRLFRNSKTHTISFVWVRSYPRWATLEITVTTCGWVWWTRWSWKNQMKSTMKYLVSSQLWTGIDKKFYKWQIFMNWSQTWFYSSSLLFTETICNWWGSSLSSIFTISKSAGYCLSAFIRVR